MNYNVPNDTIVIRAKNEVKEIRLDDLELLTLTFVKRTNEIQISCLKKSTTTMECGAAPIGEPVTLAPPELNPNYKPGHGATPKLTYEMLIGNGWTDEQVRESSEFFHLAPMRTEKQEAEDMSRDLIGLCNDITGSTFDYDELKEEAQEKIRARGKVGTPHSTRTPVENRKPPVYKGGRLTQYSASEIAEMYVGYCRGTSPTSELAKQFNVSNSAIYNWCSAITNLLNDTAKVKYAKKLITASAFVRQRSKHAERTSE